ncbi:MAG: Gfo/Idh/MocA family protein [Bryobacteraceae bacterium]
MKPKLRIGVCGLGSIGFRHARLLSKRIDVTIDLCDPSAERLNHAAELPNIDGRYPEFERLLEGRPDAVVIASPDRWHVAQSQAAAARGIPILLEKPVAESAEAARPLLAAAEQVPILVGYMLHHVEVMGLARELLDQNLIGTPLSFQLMLGAYDTLIFAQHRFSPSDRNVLFRDYTHEWDYLQWFLGPVKRTTATSRTAGDLERKQTPNLVDALLELDSGVTGTAHIDYVQMPSARRAFLIGDRGTLEIHAHTGALILRLYAEDGERHYSRIRHRDEPMERQLDHFFAVVRGEAKPCVSVADGWRALAVADAMIESAAGGQWVPVSRL